MSRIFCALLILLVLDNTTKGIEISILKHLAQGFGIFGIRPPPVILKKKQPVTEATTSTTSTTPESLFFLESRTYRRRTKYPEVTGRKLDEGEESLKLIKPSQSEFSSSAPSAFFAPVKLTLAKNNPEREEFYSEEEEKRYSLPSSAPIIRKYEEELNENFILNKYNNNNNVKEKENFEEVLPSSSSFLAIPIINNSNNADILSKKHVSVEQQILNLEAMLIYEMDKQHPSLTPVQVSYQNYDKNNVPDLSILSHLFQIEGKYTKTSILSAPLCNACNVGFGLFSLKARSGNSLETIVETAKFACNMFRIASDLECNGLIDRFAPILHYIVLERRDLTGDNFCGIVLQSFGCQTTDKFLEWTINLNKAEFFTHQLSNLPREKRQASVSKFEDEPDKITTRITSSSSSEPYYKKSQRQRDFEENRSASQFENLKILQISDIHVDPLYKTGSNTKCEQGMCCRSTNGLPNKVEDGAGYFGDYRNCDIPYHSFEMALNHISRTHQDISMIYLTGDFISHNIWSTTVEENIQTIYNCSSAIYKYFPHIRVIPVLGNHEVSPVNTFSPFGVPTNLSTDWVYAVAARAWSQWIPRESIHTFINGGFYSVEISQEFKVIVLNTNLCYTLNFWQTYESKDPAGQLRWLAKELQDAEQRRQYVHILGHVPPNTADCWRVWSKNFYRIVAKYSSTIKALYFGHTHFDDFKLYYSPEDKTLPISSLFIGSSITPFTQLNPGYKIYHVDGARGFYSKWDVLDHETWIYDLEEANRVLTPKWFRLYLASESYGIQNVGPINLGKFVVRMAENKTLFDIFYRNYHRGAEVALKNGCDNECRKKILCSTISSDFVEFTDCTDSHMDIAEYLRRRAKQSYSTTALNFSHSFSLSTSPSSSAFGNFWG